MPQDIATVRLEIQGILAKTAEADKAYYDAADVVKMSDDEYDALKDSLSVLVEQLRSYDSTDSLLQEVDSLLEGVGAIPTSGTWAKKLHPIPMGSLLKVKGTQGIMEWFQKIT